MRSKNAFALLFLELYPALSCKQTKGTAQHFIHPMSQIRFFIFSYSALSYTLTPFLSSSPWLLFRFMFLLFFGYSGEGLHAVSLLLDSQDKWSGKLEGRLAGWRCLFCFLPLLSLPTFSFLFFILSQRWNIRDIHTLVCMRLSCLTFFFLRPAYEAGLVLSGVAFETK